MKRLFVGGQVYDTETHSFRQVQILTEGDRIAALTDGTPDSDERIDCGGSWIIPGMVDVHTHGRAGYDFCTIPADKMEEILLSYAQAGTTCLFPTLASAAPEEWKAAGERIRAAAARPPRGARIAGIHWEGRYLSKKRRGAHNEDLLTDPDPTELPVLLGDGQRPVHISVAPELTGSETFIREAVRRGATVGIAHTDCTYEQAMQAIEWGATSFTHTFNCMSPLHHRQPGCVCAAMLADDAYAEFICDGMHTDPAIARLLARTKPKDKLVLITDSMEATGCPDGRYTIGGLPVIVKGGRAVTETDGALAGSTLSLLNGLYNFVRFTGIPLEDAIPYATLNPASMVGIADTVGSLSPGKYADFLIFNDKNVPSPVRVICGGRVI